MIEHLYYVTYRALAPCAHGIIAKVGKTSNPDMRMRQLQSGSSMQIVARAFHEHESIDVELRDIQMDVQAMWRGRGPIEADLIKQLRHFLKSHQEWFYLHTAHDLLVFLGNLRRVIGRGSTEYDDGFNADALDILIPTAKLCGNATWDRETA